jgi:hypothetical protein
MSPTEKILKDAMELPDSERFFVATRLLESLPSDSEELSLDDPDLIDELDRRFNDLSGLVPADELWRTK